MATKNATFRNGEADYFGDQFNSGELRLLSSTDAVLATVTLAADAFGAASAGEITANGLPLAFTGTAAAGSGTEITSATLISSDGTQDITGLTVGNASAHVILDNVNIAEGQEGSVTAFTITVPASIAAA